MALMYCTVRGTPSPYLVRFPKTTNTLIECKDFKLFWQDGGTNTTHAGLKVQTLSGDPIDTANFVWLIVFQKGINQAIAFKMEEINTIDGLVTSPWNVIHWYTDRIQIWQQI